VLDVSWGNPWEIPSCFIQLGDGFVERLELLATHRNQPA
jgi:hypothetical protein